MTQIAEKLVYSLVAVSLICDVAAADQLLKRGDFVAVVGDSITAQCQYSVFIEDYLLMCQPIPGLRVAQFGWGGETSGGFAARMENDMLRFGPSVATTCFGMNDAGFLSATPIKGQQYRDGQTAIVRGFKKAGVRVIVVGSPGCVDADTYYKDRQRASAYNQTLGEARDIAHEVAHSEGVLFADIHTPMMATMAKAKQKYGPDYHLAGGDGIHPDQNGHLVMAYAFLKALGCDGDLGKIAVDFAAGTADASGGHKVLAYQGGKIELESTRYPFCFHGDPSKPNSTSGIIELLPFNQELNRLTLVVQNAPQAGLAVTWGRATRPFTREQLKQGINLAAEFLENPFCEPFQRVESQIRQQQQFETPLITQLIHNTPDFKRWLPDQTTALDQIFEAALRRDKALAAESTAAVVPVQHSLVIGPAR